jgi:uncharacterized membrane protein
VETMMWGWGAGWWVVGAAFMVICMLMMGRMMGRGHSGHGEHGLRDDPERTLAGRLASGEIDVEEYSRLLQALRHTSHRARA